MNWPMSEGELLYMAAGFSLAIGIAALSTLVIFLAADMEGEAKAESKAEPEQRLARYHAEREARLGAYEAAWKRNGLLARNEGRKATR